MKDIFEEKQIKEVICLGIGRISDCVIAKHQLAFISLITEQFKLKSVKFFDPIISEQEKEVFESLNYQVLTENKEGKYQATHHTLFYLPHCPKQLTNNLLWANWNPENLKNIVLISNSFKNIIEETPERLLRPNAHYILEINQFTKESEIENCFKFEDIFNNFAIHQFEVKQVEKKFWESKPEPNYSSDDLELVQNVSN